MPFYLRQSLNLGWLRLNASKSGIGASVGTTGFRVGVRPNGSSYVHAGRYGLYYREELGGSKTNREPISYTKSSQSIEEVDSHSFKQSSQAELLRRLEQSYMKFRWDLFVAVLTSVFSIYYISDSYLVSFIILSGGISLFWFAHRWEKKRRSLSLTFVFENDDSSLFEGIVGAFDALPRSREFWSARTEVWTSPDPSKVRNPTTNRFVKKSTITKGKSHLPWVTTNIEIPHLHFGFRTIYFTPIGMLIYDGNGIGHIDYEDISVSHEERRYAENYPTSELKIVSSTWEHSNNDGTQDRRFKENKQTFICQFGCINVSSKTGLRLQILTPSTVYSRKFTFYFDRAIREYKRC